MEWKPLELPNITYLDQLPIELLPAKEGVRYVVEERNGVLGYREDATANTMKATLIAVEVMDGNIESDSFQG